MDRQQSLVQGLQRLCELKGRCEGQIMDNYGLPQLNMKQIAYLRAFGCAGGSTTSQLARTLDLSKPSVTAMAKRFIRMGYVYREDCSVDGRVHYLKLTEKGMRLADLDRYVLERLAQRLEAILTPDELDTVSRIFNKLEEDSPVR